MIEEGIEAKEGHEIKGTTSAEGYRKKTSSICFPIYKDYKKRHNALDGNTETLDMQN